MPESLLITHCNIIRNGFILEKERYILIEKGRISSIGSMDDLATIEADNIITGTGKLALPGLINGHNHSPMTLFRGLADDLELHDWLNNYIFPAEMKHVSEEMVYWCSKLAAAEMLLSGTTCVGDGYFFCEQTARAFIDAGLRATVAHGILDFPAPGVADPAKNIATVSQFIADWKDVSPLIRPGVFAHSAYTCSPKTLKEAKTLADHHGVRFFIHAAETEEERAMLLEPQGQTTIQHLAKLGLLDSNCVLIHAVWLTDEDIDIIAESGAHVVLCPQSNYKLASGLSNAAGMVNKNITVGLGTDGAAGNNSLDMFREMDIFAKSEKAFLKDPTAFPAEQVFTMATRNNNTILGLNNEAAIKEGARADIVLLDLETPPLTPFYNQDLLIYSAKGNNVHTVLVDGKLVVDEKRIISFDLAETMENVRNLATNLHL